MEAEVYAEEDVARRELADTRNQAANLIRSMEELLNNNGPAVITQSLRTPALENIDRLKKLLADETTGKEVLQSVIKPLQQSLYEVTKAVEDYSQVERVKPN